MSCRLTIVMKNAHRLNRRGVLRATMAAVKLSVIMPIYNGEAFVASALESIRSQTDDDVEVVVVDDGSTDRTIEIAQGFRDKMCVRVISPGRLGNWVAATNLGLREATGDWACFLHHDDHWLPGRVAKVKQLISRATGALVLHNALFIGPQDEKLGPWTCPLSGQIISSERFRESLLIQNFIAISAPAFRREAALESGGLDLALWHSADWDFWLRLGALGPVAFSDEILTVFRVHDESQTSARALQPGEWEEQLTIVLDRHLPRLSCSEAQRKRIRRTSLASIAVNASLAAVSRGNQAGWGHLLSRVLCLGPIGWFRYIRNSRIQQRLGARLKVRFGRKQIHEVSVHSNAFSA